MVSGHRSMRNHARLSSGFQWALLHQKNSLKGLQLIHLYIHIPKDFPDFIIYIPAIVKIISNPK